MTVNYSEPLLQNFGKDYKGTPFSLLDKYEGQFVLSKLDDNTIKVWALANSWNHSQLCGECKVESPILGGGQITFNDEKRRVFLYGTSMDFGSLPNKLLEDYFSHFGYTVKAEMLEKQIMRETREWFEKNGINS